MSSSSTNELRSTLRDAGSVVRRRDGVVEPVRRLAFWMAVALPFLYLPMLVIGFQSTAELTAFVVLLCCNGVALLIGHPYMRDSTN